MRRKGLFYILDAIEKLLNFGISLIIIFALMISLYAIWDDGQVYIKAERTRQEIAKYKPDPVAEESVPDFAEFIEINPDVKGWISLEDTRIDYPVLQTYSNFIYLNRDVFGNYALAGSIFMDHRNSSDFHDPYTLIYGHYMNGDEMFGSLARFKDQEFFEQHRTGTLMTLTEKLGLKVVAVMVTNSSDPFIFSPEEISAARMPNLVEYIKNTAIFFDEQALTDPYEVPKIIALSTCSYEYSGARTVVFCICEEG